MIKKGRVLFRSLTTPDGTELISRHRHDFVSHTDKTNGKYYMLDGGLDYCRFSATENAVWTQITDEDPFELVRQHFTRGSRGVNMDKELKYIKLAEMTDSHLDATIEYCEDHRADAYLDIYLAEREYRIKHKIAIPDTDRD